MVSPWLVQTCALPEPAMLSLTVLAARVEDFYAVLRFGGGCQGCSAVDVTLKSGVEKTLLEQLPQLQGVRDMAIYQSGCWETGLALTKWCLTLFFT